jgi:hypothetical protein
MTGTFERFSHGLGAALAPIGDLTAGNARARTLLDSLGWSLPPGVPSIGLEKIDPSKILSALSRIGALNFQIDTGSGGVSADSDLAAAYVQLLSEINTFLSNTTSLAGSLSAPAAYVSATHIDTELVPRLINLLIVDSVAANLPLLFALGAFFGIFRLEPFEADDAKFQTAHLRRVIHWDRVPRVFTDSKNLFRDVFGWGTADCDVHGLALALGSVAQTFGVANTIRALPRFAEERLAGVSVPDADTSPGTQIVVDIVRDLGMRAGVNMGVTAFSLRPSAAGATDGGIGIAPFVAGTSNTTIQLTPSLSFLMDATVDLSSGVVLELRGGRGLALKTSFNGGTAGSSPDGHVRVGFSYTDPSGKAINILAVGDQIGLETKQLILSGGVAISGGVLSQVVLTQLKGGRFFIDPSQMDSFLAKIIPVAIDVNFDFGVGWSGAYGFFFEGNASPAITIGLHQSLGPFTLDTLHAGLDTGGGDTLPVELSLSGKGTLGPFSVTVDRIGIRVALAFHKGNLGPIDLSVSFKPPNGLGMALDAGLISGGGYLAIDEQKHRYAGVLECSIADIVQVKIIGVLDTVLPDGTPDFSLLLVITTEFPPIQLSFGFTLIGVGGIGGVNRTMAMDALRAGFRAHHLDSVMFPSDPIDNAPRIISDLSSFFPPADGRYVFGPMFELGWGTPTLISLSLGIILEIPDPIRLAILGLIKMALPSDDIALVEVHIDILGLVDFGAKLLTIQGSMYDSRVTIFSMSGEMALMLAWGDDANFAFSLGGMNPRFQPPPNFPQLKRCCVSIGDGDNPRFSSSNYFAVTSNSVQFGASVDLYAAAAGFSIHGWIGFDALFIFTPFSFIIEFSAGLDVEFEGESLCAIHVDGRLSGPHPWHVHGDAGFHILFIDVSASVDLSFGESDPVVLPSVSVLPDLEKALTNPQSWSTTMPANATQAVSLAPRAPGDRTLVVYPMGTLEVREKVVPLGIAITKYGNGKPSDGNLFTISSVTVDDKPEARQWLTDRFAIGQFTDLSDDQKLTAQSYQYLNSGISIGSSDVVTSRDVECVVAYQDGYIDGDDTGMRLRRFYVLPEDIHLAYCRLGAGFVSATRTKGVAAFTPPGTVSAVSSTDLQYVVASTEDLSLRADILASPVTQFEAQSALLAHITTNPAQRGSVQVVAIHEVAA